MVRVGDAGQLLDRSRSFGGILAALAFPLLGARLGARGRGGDRLASRDFAGAVIGSRGLGGGASSLLVAKKDGDGLGSRGGEGRDDAGLRGGGDGGGGDTPHRGGQHGCYRGAGSPQRLSMEERGCFGGRDDFLMVSVVSSKSGFGRSEKAALAVMGEWT